MASVKLQKTFNATTFICANDRHFGVSLTVTILSSRHTHPGFLHGVHRELSVIARAVSIGLEVVGAIDQLG